MKIIITQGKKWKGDKRFWIETKDNEAELFSLYRLLILVNKLSINEWEGYTEKGYSKRGLPFSFEEALISVIEKGKEGIDLSENDEEAKKLCNRYGLSFNKWKQTELNEFIEENGKNKS